VPEGVSELVGLGVRDAVGVAEADAPRDSVVVGVCEYDALGVGESDGEGDTVADGVVDGDCGSGDADGVEVAEPTADLL
jgi:hypothetical protein